MPIPKHLYQVWFQGCENLREEKFKLNVKQWQNLNPEWKYKCLDENDLKEACKTYSDKCLAAFDKTTIMHAKIDLGRLVIVFLTGGMYVDMDMYALRPLSYSSEFNDVVNNKEEVLGVSVLSKINIIERLITQGTKNVMYNNAIVVCNKGNKIVKTMIEDCIERILVESEDLDSFTYISKTTGPWIFSNNVHALSEYNHVHVFSEDTFEPVKISDKTIAIHDFEMSWITGETKRVCKVYNKHKNTVYVLLILITLVVLRKWL